MDELEETIIKSIMEHEGQTFEEAKLSYQRRKELPTSAFCGPNRSYPAHDAAHVRNALARLSTFGGRLKPGVRARILACIKRRAKRFGVEVSETAEGKLALAKWDETLSKEEREKRLKQIEETVKHYFGEQLDKTG